MQYDEKIYFYGTIDFSRDRVFRSRHLFTRNTVCMWKEMKRIFPDRTNGRRNHDCACRHPTGTPLHLDWTRTCVKSPSVSHDWYRQSMTSVVVVDSGETVTRTNATANSTIFRRVFSLWNHRPSSSFIDANFWYRRKHRSRFTDASYCYSSRPPFFYRSTNSQWTACRRNQYAITKRSLGDTYAEYSKTTVVRYRRNVLQFYGGWGSSNR